ncbi:hydrogenase expression/formation protein [Lentisalinibacter sediminis]|uniref:hydrogenase expression/formation protein n=1 Tax=Lentisalinibacter sediminis TaxID=2992237 RepID=UPI0038657FFC
MNIRDIPVVAIGPGSQPSESDGAELQYIDMPRGMSMYEPPSIPDPESVENLTGARAAMDWLQRTLDDWQPGKPALADISGLDEKNRELVNQVLGEGEVAVKFTGDFLAQTQESVLTGVWRTFYFNDDGKVTHDLLEVAEAPFIARLASLGRDRTPADISGREVPPGALNAPAILTEIADRVANREPGDETHVVNLTLLPVSDEDLLFLDETLGKGPVDILARGYGRCIISATRVRDVWWVRYANSMAKLLLNSLEITDLPHVVEAAPEDVRDSGKRLAQLLEAYWTED